MPKKQLSENKKMLKMLFREIVELTDEEQTERLIEAYRSGNRNAVFVIGENSRGLGYKTAFSSFTVPHSAWKLYTEPPEVLGGSVFPTGSVN